MAKTSKAVLASAISFAAVILAACGGGGASTIAGNAFGNDRASTTVTTTTTTTRLPIGATVTTLKVESTGAGNQTSVPLTFGQVFVPGEVGANESITGTLDDGTPIGLQVDAKARHADGSLRHAVISAVLPQLNAGQTRTINLVKTGAYTAAAPATALGDLLNDGFNAVVNVNLGGTLYTASAATALNSGSVQRWLTGPHVNEWFVSSPLKTVGGIEHPHLTARFAVRSYVGLNNPRVDVIVENNKTFATGPQNFTYDVNILINGQSAYSMAGLTHYHHARWRKTFWVSREPEIHVKHDTAYLIASKSVSNYDQSVIPAESALADLATQLTADKVGPMKVGLVLPYMPTSGGRADIGPLPSWSVLYLLSMDKRAKDAMLASADGAASWSIHYRDEATGYPVRLDNEINKNISVHGNLAHLGPLPVPRCAGNVSALCNTPYTPDTAHQPSMVYLPYLITGDHFYLEELQFWAAWNPLETAPGAHGFEKGLLRWAQVRGQAWSLRTLGQAAYITPDSHYLKNYFAAQVGYNLGFYNATYTVANPNQLGAYDGSGEESFVSDSGQSAPWQDDFFTWSVGYLTELGFTDAQPLLAWKAKFPVGRMTAPGYCWIEGAAYFLNIRPAAGMPVYPTFAQAYAATIKNNAMIDDDGNPITHPLGLLYLDQPCGSQAQADWRTAATGDTWLAGQMTGYSFSPIGYPSNMQPALAVAVNSGIPNASQAWNIFINRSVKPDYRAQPQWAIIPR
ncbi:hypothetical protein EDC30_102293 [Paucimonas lemoignei]|uniref:Lipoprotein n=1 Tax=Paucimonas lemoignei TaxID=29443 RepID=A0A4R3I059_PAULE|nr:hypothetical protein [Paucimonas lemoignei]TCS38554.1 hypothetical protein EDC30_102293 [Paucimonas lemoignei]